MKLKALACVLLFLGAASSAQAVTLTSSETLEDGQPFELLNRDLTRTRVDSSGAVSVETDNATITAENNVDSDFGVTNTNDVTYSHDVSWLTPPADAFVNATLTIKSWANIGGNDTVITESVTLGNLNNGGLLTLGFSTTIFDINNPVTLNALLVDGYLNITIDKNATGGLLSRLNAFSVYSSTLDVEYNPVEVPEPASMALLACGLGAGFCRRKRKN